MTQALFRIVNDTVAQIPNGVSPALFDFLTQCFQKDPNQRPSAKKLRTHHWLTAPPEELDEASTVAAAAGLARRMAAEREDRVRRLASGLPPRSRCRRRARWRPDSPARPSRRS